MSTVTNLPARDETEPAPAEPETPETGPDDETPDEPVDVSQLPLFEGYRIAETRLNFSGNNLVARELADGLKLGAEVRLVITGRVVSATQRPTEGRLASDSRAIAVETVETDE